MNARRRCHGRDEAAFASFFTHEGASLPEAPRLRRLAKRGLAEGLLGSPGPTSVAASPVWPVTYSGPLSPTGPDHRGFASRKLSVSTG